MGELVVGQKAALLVAHACHYLLVWLARRGRLRAGVLVGAAGADAEAAAEAHVLSGVEGVARRLFAASERRGADRVLIARQQLALLVAEARKLLLVGTARLRLARRLAVGRLLARHQLVPVIRIPVRVGRLDGSEVCGNLLQAHRALDQDVQRPAGLRAVQRKHGQRAAERQAGGHEACCSPLAGAGERAGAGASMPRAAVVVGVVGLRQQLAALGIVILCCPQLVLQAVHCHRCNRRGRTFGRNK
mmetsp:Transcript_92668/g.246186  ORF Transcript_92668/g.246186 Transcript_92668/m.246186 type:complete len:246 (+) Transcript_92668:268-1005(+)